MPETLTTLEGRKAFGRLWLEPMILAHGRLWLLSCDSGSGKVLCLMALSSKSFTVPKLK